MDWTVLRRTSHSSGKLYFAHRRYMIEPSDENLGDFLDTLVPLVHWVIDEGFMWMKDQDRDNIISEVLLKVSGKMSYFDNREKKVFQSLLWVTIRRTVIDYLRANDILDEGDLLVDPHQVPLKTQAPIPKQVDAKLILEDLPGQVASFALSRDRFGFGARVLKVVTYLMICGDPIPECMLKNWYGIKNPRLCISFVYLMCRLFVHVYRYKFEAMIDERSWKMIDEIGQKMIYESW